ncbi:hypothetical protein ACH5RR_035744 [Cinchona calisaya]|uniref:Uncharacterized protein n=1 Tax=Cinchona calisaya TaxID=153742 RepID=A0ABD2Y654_9GENT
MELLKLSKFKLQLKALISEVKQLKEREASANDQVRVLTQKQKLREEEFSTTLMEFQAELSSSNEIRQKLEKKVNCLERENDMLEAKLKELKETINSLLQSKESFVQAYEDSYGEMKRAVEERERKIAILSEKVKAHSLLFDTIEKEANCIMQVVHNAECAIKEKEEIVVGLKRKVDEVSTWEKLFFEKINNLENKLRDDEDELKRKDNIILGLEAQLDAVNFTEDFQPKVDEISMNFLCSLCFIFSHWDYKISRMSHLDKQNLQKALSAKELVIHNLVIEKQALHREVGILGFVMKKIQDAVSRMDEQDKKAFSSMLDEPGECITIEGNGVNSFRHVQANEDISHHDTSKRAPVENSASPEHQNCSAMKSFKDSNIDSCVSEEAAHLPTQSASSQPQLAANAVEISITEGKDEFTEPRDTVDSESSGTQAGNS